MKRLLIAAQQGAAATQFNLGVFFDNRLDDNHYPVPGNRVQAMKWLLLAAEQGLPRAQVKLAEMYADGLGANRGFGECLHVALAGGRELERHTSRTSSVGLCANSVRNDAGPNRRGAASRAEMEAERAAR